MIYPMVRIRLMGPRARLGEVLAVIQDVGLLHLAAAPEGGPLHPSPLTPVESRRRRQLMRILEDADAVLEGSSPPAAPAGAAGTSDLARWARLARRVRRSLGRLGDRAATLEEEQALLQRYQGFFGAFEALLRARAIQPGFSAFHIVLRADQADTLPALERALGELLGDACETLSRPLPGGETALLLLVPASRAAAVERLLGETRVQEVPVPSGYGSTLLEAIPRMRARAAEIPTDLDAVRRERADLLHSSVPELARARSVLRDRLARMDALALTAVTAHTFVLDGWLPAGTEPRLARALEQSFGPTVVVETIDRAQWQAEDAPVVLRNPRLFRPFELLTGMLPLPRYGTIDPTPYVAVFFPMFFGLMLGDAGYGILVALLALVLRRRSAPASTLRAVAEVAGPCALFAIVFGILFGEYFGDLGHRWLGLRPLWLDRQDAIIPFLVLTLALGLVHVVLGLVLGVLSAGRLHPRQAIGRGLSAGMIVLIVVALLGAFEILPRSVLTPAVVGLLVAFPILILVEGIVAAVELVTALGHILSYARIMALGTASVMLAIVANRLAGTMGSAVVGALFALLFHLVNFGLGLFSPTIHALRLHYVEFFGTFYSPGGTRYEPLQHWTPHTA
ncbi:MAG TPA: V-type ATPase 116kDa subunit family protein [Gemmatimonadales bacterium]|nr:V-type ATPase 116kDa subunit family protein [Gemmatimonadales bacterium]